MTRTRFSVDDFLSVVFVACLLVIGARLTYVQWKNRTAYRHLIVRRVPNWRYLIAGRIPSIGNPGAPISIIEFADYECPFCREEEQRLQMLVARQPGSIAVYRYNLPQIRIHAYARLSAIAAECAAKEGVTETFQVEVFENQANLAAVRWADLAKQAGVKDVDAFSNCLNKRESDAIINSDLAASKALGISATPTILINGALVVGAISQDDLDKLCADAHGTGS